MVVPKKAKKFGGSSSHQKAMMSNLAISLIENGRIVTTISKGKYLRGLIDKLINFAKKDDLAARRMCLKLLNNNNAAVQKLFNEVAPQMYDRSSGFTRVVKYKNRLGDGAQMVIVDLLNQ